MATVNESIEVAVPVRTAYNEWTQFESFPNFMGAVESVTQIDDTTNHWVASIGGVEREFDTRITDQVPDQVIAWESVDGKSHSGRVTFHPVEVVERDVDDETLDPRNSGPGMAGLEGSAAARGLDPDLGRTDDAGAQAPRSREGTRVDVEFTWDDATFLEKVGGKLGLDDLQVKKDLKNFKKLVEEKGAEGGWRGEVHGGQETSGPGGTGGTTPGTTPGTAGPAGL
ncbi:SRPBCC family protein [Zhihengliuella alba]|uniref:SRPBCC family protein n=1 Tax=Zhihengliuella alba TaxID=547018 RepID=A0ABP7DS47_9MICC